MLVAEFAVISIELICPFISNNAAVDVKIKLPAGFVLFTVIDEDVPDTVIVVVFGAVTVKLV